MRRAFTITGIILIGCSGILVCNLTREGYVIEITPRQIQDKLDQKFPISKQYLLLLNLTLTDPEVILREGSDRIGFAVSAMTNVRVNETDLEGRAQMTCGIRYDPEEGALFLVDPRVESLGISLLPEKYQDEVIAAASIAVKEFLDDYEVYRLDKSDFKQRLAKLVLRSAVVQNGVFRITLALGT